MDLNVNNYKKHELIDILEIEEPTHENIEKKTNIYIDKFSKENNIDYAQFFVDVKNKLLEGKNIVISAHGNSIRALCKFLFELDNNKISLL